ncbi:MAG: PKD domain-containing protein, partial [Woeseiaceae bacterium]|nr:PKD domain-containing protein [Woeseiaceae bacterium]
MSRVGKSLVLIALLGLAACNSGNSAINPVANAGPDQTVGSNATVTLDGSGSTGSGTLTYSWSQTGGTTVALSSASASRPTFTAPAVTADEVLAFQLTVTDANNLTSTDAVNITVVDGIPTADAGPDQTVAEGAAVTLDGSGSVQTNGGTIVSYAWSQTGGPAVANLAGADTSSPTFDAPSVAMDEVLTFELTVTDDNGDTDTDTVAITVQNDIPPVADAGPDQSVDEGTNPVTLDGSGSSDAVGTIAAYSWSQSAGTAVVLNGGDTASPTFTAPQVGPGGDTLTFELTVTDDAAQSDTDTVDIVVNNVNVAPLADAGADQLVAEGASVNLDGTGSSDPDGSIVAYAWTQTAGPTVTLNNATTATPDFAAPLVAAQTTLTFELTVTDDVGAQDTGTVDVVIDTFNLPPIANAGTDQTVTELTPVNLDATGSSDPDGGIAAYAWTQTAGPGVTLVGGNTVTPSFTAPSVTTVEVLTFQLIVTDNDPLNPKQDTDTVDITVEPPNTPPTANAGPDQSVAEQSAASLDGTGSADTDGSIASYAWTQTAGTSVTLTGAGTAMPTFTAPSVDAAGETLTFELTVTDDDGDADTDLVDVDVINDPALTAPPTAVAGADQVVSAGDIVTLNGTFSSDSDGTITAYAWTQTGGTTVTLNNANTAVATFTAPATPETLTFELQVTDNDAATGTDTLTVRVNAPPIADAGADQLVVESSTVALDGTGSSDGDGNIAAYQWTQASGTVVILTNASTPIATFTAPTGPATLVFELTVTDNDSSTDTDTIEVRVNAAPTADAGPDQSVDEQSAVSLDASASSDADGTITGYAWTQTGGTVVTLTGANTATPSFTAPAVSTTGQTLTFQVQVTDDDGATDTDTVDVQVNNDPTLSDPPTALAGPDQVVSTGAIVTLDGSASIDTDGTITAYQWTQISGISVSLANANAAVATFTAPTAPATLVFELEVTDNDSSTGTDTIEVRVNAAPTANAGPDQSVDEQSAVNLTAAGSSDVDGSIVGYAWTQTAGTTITLTGVGTATPSFTAPSVDAGGETLTFEVEVTDNDGATDTDTVDIQVNNDPTLTTPPTSVAGPAQVVSAGAAVTLDGSGSSDSDGTITGYQWNQIGGTTVTLTNANTVLASFTAPAAPDELTFELVVTDNDAATDSSSTTVRVNAPPIANAGPDQSVNEQTAVNLTASGSSDVDGSITGYSWTQTDGTAVVLTNANTATPDFTAPSVSLAGELLTFEVEVTDDDGATDIDTVDIQVDNDPALNILPTAVAGPDQNVGEGVSVTLDGSGSSDDTVITDYQWTQTDGTAVALTNADQAIASFTSPTGPATLTFELEVTDEEGGTATDEIHINVSGTVSVSGKVTFDFVPHAGLGFGGLDYGNITQRPARLVTVQVIDAGDDTTVIATTTTDSVGDYSFILDPGLDIFLRV